jgi:hypothetical protein
MAVQLASCATPIDVLYRVLDKGIVIDAWMRFGLVRVEPSPCGDRVTDGSGFHRHLSQVRLWRR